MRRLWLWVGLVSWSCTGGSDDPAVFVDADVMVADAHQQSSCSGPGCMAEVIADLQPWPGALASDGVDLFWCNRGIHDDLGNLQRGAIMARPIVGDEVRVVVPALRYPTMLAVMNDYVYWKSEHSVWRAPKDGNGEIALVYESSESIAWMEFSLSNTAIVVLDSVGGAAQIITIAPDDLSQSSFVVGPGSRAWSLSVSNQSAYTLTGVVSSAERELLSISLSAETYSVLSPESELVTYLASDDDSVFVYGDGLGILSQSLESDESLVLFDQDYAVTDIEVAPTFLIASYALRTSVGEETGLWLVPKTPGASTHLLHKEATRVGGALVVGGDLYWSESVDGEEGVIRKYHLP